MSDYPKNLLFADGHVGLELTNFLLSEYKKDLEAVVTTSENEISTLARHENVEVCVASETSYLLERLNHQSPIKDKKDLLIQLANLDD